MRFILLVSSVAVTHAENCTFEQVEGRVYGTGHIETPKTSSADECCSLCSANSQCRAFTWAADTTTCYIKDNDADQGVKDKRVSGRSPVTPASCTTQPGVEMLGNEVATPVAVDDEAACCTSCASDSHCAFWTYEGGTGGLCHHKNANGPDYSRQNASCTSGYVGTSPPAPPPPTNVSVVLGGKRHRTGSNFVCWNIDASENRGFFWRNLSAGYDYGAQLARQAAEIGRLQDAGFSFLRFGGSGNDYLTYQFDGEVCENKCMNETLTKDFYSFAEAANSRIIFGLSMNTGLDLTTSAGGFPYPWDPSNARELLKWTLDNGYGDLIYGLELGNEQNGKYSAEKMAVNFGILYNLTVELWPDEDSRPKLLGPDRHSFHDGNIDSYIKDFVVECQKANVPLYGATHHEYIEVDSSSFTSPSKLDKNAQVGAAINKSVRSVSDSVKIFGGEIGPHNGGSPQCDHTSMRWANFGDSLWYADALAAKSRSGYEGFCRQDYIGADYGLVDCSTGAPLPDYFTALAWAGNMGPTVLNVDPVPDSKSAIRVYAHCAAKAAKAPSGAVVLLVINLGDTSTRIDVPTELGSVSRELVLSPSYDLTESLIEQTGLLGTGILLNGKVLQLAGDGSVPELVGKAVGKPEAHVPATSLAFFVLEDAKHEACSHSIIV